MCLNLNKTVPDSYMKYFLLFFLAILTVRAQDSVQVIFKIQANNIPDTAKVYITGNLRVLGNWQPDKVSLINTHSNYWEKTFYLPGGKNIEYKITLGSWKSEAVNKEGRVPPNNKLLVSNDTVIQLKIDYWKDQFKEETNGQITGEVQYYRNIKGKGIPPRDIIVWLPPGYNTDIQQRYPVLYMQDGQNLFDPATSAFGTDWQLDETADSLIKKGLIKPIIIVGIYNTKWRYSEYAENDTGFAYMKFVVDKVKPLIDSTYRTLPDPGNTAVGGSSLGALISFMLAWNYPDIFSKVICISPALKVYNFNYVDNVQKYGGQRKNLKFFFDTGIHSPDSLLVPGTGEMINALENLGYKMGKDILWHKDKEGQHNEASWAKIVWRPLMFFFGKKE